MFGIKYFFYDPSWMLQLSESVWTLRSSVWVVFFNNFLHIDTTCRSKINSDQKRLFLSVSLYPLSFFVNTPFKIYLKFTLGLLKVYLRFTTQNLLEVYSRFIGGLLKVCLKFNQRMKLTQGSKFTQGLKLTLKV